MSHIATLISNPARPSVDAVSVDAARALLPGAGSPVVLDPRIAVDIPFTASGDLRDLVEALRRKLAPAPIDVVIQPAAGRRKRLLLSDMDSTMIDQECIDELADYVALKPRVAEITERAMRGEIEFEPALRERVALLKNLPVGVIGEVIEKRITLAPGGKTLVGTMRANGAHTYLISGGFTQFTERIAEAVGFDEHRGNVLVIEDGKLAGRVEEPVLGRDAKLATLQELTARFKLRPDETLVAGDGANDLPMIEAAGLGVAFHAKPVVAAAAHARIDHGDLTALLYLQGYKRAKFVE